MTEPEVRINLNGATQLLNRGIRFKALRGRLANTSLSLADLVSASRHSLMHSDSAQPAKNFQCPHPSYLNMLNEPR